MRGDLRRCQCFGFRDESVSIRLGAELLEARVFEDNLYLQGFFIWQLLPNRLSWLPGVLL